MQKDHKAGSKSRLRGRTINGVALRFQMKELVKEAELDAEVSESAPGNERRRRKHKLMVCRKYGREEDGQEARKPQQRAVEQQALAHLDFVIERLPKVHAWETLGRKLRDVRDGLTRLQRDAKHVRPLALDPLGHKSDRRRDRLDALGVEVRPNRARSDKIVSISRQPPLNLPVRGIGQ